MVLGRKYRDTLTNWEGTATSRTEYLYGCVRVCLEGKSSEGKPEEYWFDEQRLESVDVDVPIVPTATSGGPQPTPPRTGLRG